VLKKNRSMFTQSPNLWRIIRHLPKFIKLYWRLFWDKRVPIYLKLILIGAVLYVISPIDIIPDWLYPIIGEMDDVAVLFIALRLFITRSPQDVVREHVRQIESQSH